MGLAGYVGFAPLVGSAPSRWRRAAIVAVLAPALLLGLLMMHLLTNPDSPASSSAHMSSSVVVETGDGVAPLALAPLAQAPLPPEHVDVFAACVLVLMVGLLTMVAASIARVGPLRPHPSDRIDAPAADLLPAAPSLTLLSISRI